MKVYYLRLPKDEQKKIKSNFYQTEKGKRLVKYSNISFVMCILLIIYSIYLSIDTYINHKTPLYYYYSILLIIIAIILIISIRNTRIKAINNSITIDKKKKK